MLICYKQKVLQRFVFRHPCPSYRCCCQYENFLLLPGLANGMSAKITLSGRCAAAGGGGMKWAEPSLYTHQVYPSTYPSMKWIPHLYPSAYPNESNAKWVPHPCTHTPGSLLRSPRYAPPCHSFSKYGARTLPQGMVHWQYFDHGWENRGVGRWSESPHWKESLATGGCRHRWKKY